VLFLIGEIVDRMTRSAPRQNIAGAAPDYVDFREFDLLERLVEDEVTASLDRSP
jgi:hypothetical protein